MTKEVCAEAMGMKLVEDTHTREHLKSFFENNIYKEIPENNWKMAVVPEGAFVLDNGNGMAPGLILEKVRLPFCFRDLRESFTLCFANRCCLIFRNASSRRWCPEW